MERTKLSRREFLAKTGKVALAAGVGISAFSKAGASARPTAYHATQGSPNEKVRIGIIGCGGIGNHHWGQFRRYPEQCEIVACSDVYQPHLDGMLKRASESNLKVDGYKDYRRILERKDVDAVVVATPDHWHAIPTIEACEAGKHVFVEKPASHNVLEGLAMVNAAREHKRVVQVGLQQRSGAHFQEAVEIARSGKLGKITMAQCWNVGNEGGMGNPPDSAPPAGLDWDFWLGPAPMRAFNQNRCIYNFRWFWDYAGGKVTDWGVHLIDIVLWAMDDPHPLYATGVGGKFALDDNRDTPDTVECTWQFMGWTLNYCHRAANGYPIAGRGYGIIFYGQKANLYVSREGLEIHPEGDRAEPYKRGGSAQSEPHADNFLKAIRTGAPLACDIATGVRSTIVPLLGNIALRTGKTVHWDPKKGQITNDKEANRLLGRDWRKPWGIPKRYIKPID